MVLNFFAILESNCDIVSVSIRLHFFENVIVLVVIECVLIVVFFDDGVKAVGEVISLVYEYDCLCWLVVSHFEFEDGIELAEIVIV